MNEFFSGEALQLYDRHHHHHTTPPYICHTLIAFMYKRPWTRSYALSPQKWPCLAYLTLTNGKGRIFFLISHSFTHSIYALFFFLPKKHTTERFFKDFHKLENISERKIVMCSINVLLPKYLQLFPALLLTCDLLASAHNNSSSLKKDEKHRKKEERDVFYILFHNTTKYHQLSGGCFYFLRFFGACNKQKSFCKGVGDEKNEAVVERSITAKQKY